MPPVMRVAVFLAHMRNLAALGVTCGRGILQPDEERRFDAMASSKRRRQFLLGRFLALRALEHEYGGQARSWRVHTDGAGRPFVVAHGCAVPAISISHSGEWAVCALCGADALGVDIEALKRRDLDALARGVLAPTEQAALGALSEAAQLQAFYRLWTLKEAYLKALGRGLDVPLGELAFALEEPPRLVAAPAEARAWQFRSFLTTPGYIAALAVDSASDLLPAVLVMNAAGRFVERALGG